MSLLHPSRPDLPHLDTLHPRTALPGAAFELFGSNLLAPHQTTLPTVSLGDTPASFDLARATRALVRVPTGAISSDLVLHHNGLASNPLYANVGVPMVEDLHMISNPAADADGNLFAMVSGPRGEQVPVSIFRVARDLQVSPFVRGITNVSALAFGPPDASGQSNLFASSRSEGIIYRITPSAAVTVYAEGMGIATGLAFDPDGNLYVGDRSGTIFKLTPRAASAANPLATPEIFVYATLEPSVAFYHLCFRSDGTLLVTAPTTSSHQPIYAIAADGSTSIFFQGLGRPQGMAFDVDDNLYVAASLHGDRGIVRIGPSKDTGTMEAELVVAGNDLVGLCFLEDGCCALATNTTIFHTDLGIEGRPLL
jgi:hypothetical protein